jgi:hypothetical protein
MQNERRRNVAEATYTKSYVISEASPCFYTVWPGSKTVIAIQSLARRPNFVRVENQSAKAWAATNAGPWFAANEWS